MTACQIKIIRQVVRFGGNHCAKYDLFSSAGRKTGAAAGSGPGGICPGALRRCLHHESANAIKIQIWVTLIANLLLMIMKKKLIRSWSFSGLATMIRITLMYYVDFYSLFNHPEKDWEMLLSVARKEDYQLSIF